jgi:hypothetical protein
METELEWTKEKTFNSTCEICKRKDTPCRKHHIIPRRLLKKLPLELTKKWEYQKLIICNSCQGYFHPEQKLYRHIFVLEDKIKRLEEEIKNLEKGMYG